MEVKTEIGNVYERLTVIEFSCIDERRHARWMVACSCGSQTFEVLGYNLRRGRTRSCGCLQIEAAAKMGRNNRHAARTNYKENQNGKAS